MRILVWVINPTEKAKLHGITEATEFAALFAFITTYNAFSHSKNDLDFSSVVQGPQR